MAIESGALYESELEMARWLRADELGPHRARARAALQMARELVALLERAADVERALALGQVESSTRRARAQQLVHALEAEIRALDAVAEERGPRGTRCAGDPLPSRRQDME
jgi:hypothetical protein